MERYDYSSTELAGAARSAAILADGFDLADDAPPLTELICPACRHLRDHGWTEGECLCDETNRPEPDPEIRAAFEEFYGPAMAVADLPF